MLWIRLIFLLPKVEELNKKFAELKKNKKKIYAYGTYLDNKNYPLATAADEIIMMPSASANVSLTGYNYTNLYYKKLLDNLGVNMEVVKDREIINPMGKIM